MKKDSTKLQDAQQPQKDAREILTTDEHAGRGGSYVFDPATGTRIPAFEPEKESP